MGLVAAQKELIFRDEDHSYWLGDLRLLSVTEVLKLCGKVDTTWFTEQGRLLGQAVHEAVWLEIVDDLDYDGLHPLVRPRVDAWLKFRRECRYKPAVPICEKHMHHPQLLYGATPDVPGWINGRPAMPDVKNGDAKTADYQTAAYAELPEVVDFFGKVPDRFHLRLRPDGDYRLNPHSNPNDWLEFVKDLRSVRGW